MTDRIDYECSVCGNRRNLPANEPAPECCKKVMNLALPVCEMPTSAESSRMDDDSDPCDNGRAG